MFTIDRPCLLTSLQFKERSFNDDVCVGTADEPTPGERRIERNGFAESLFPSPIEAIGQVA